MESTWDRYYGITKKLSLLAGQWPYQNKNERVLRMSMITMATVVVNIPQVCKIVRCDRDLECIFKIMPSYILTFVIMGKLYIGHFKTSKIKILIDRVFINWRRLQNREEYEIMRKYVGGTKWLVLIYSVVCLTGATIFVSGSLIPHILDVMLPLNDSRPIVLPYEGYFFVDERKYFFYIFFHGLVALEMAIIGLVAFDTMLLTLVEHVCGVFTVAGLRFERLVHGDIDVVEITNNDINGMYNKKMACCVNVHCAALEFAEYLENIFSINRGIELLLVTIILSITLFQITANSDNMLEAFRHSIYVCSQLMHLFLLCWEGQKLIDHSVQLYDKIYSCTWYKIPVKSQKLILHVMKRCLRPKFISAGRIFIFSLQGFTTIMQTSMSYFTLLSSIQ